MASSENLASIEQWAFRPTFADSWISEAFARDTETLTKALQKSLCNYPVDAATPPGPPFFNLVKPTLIQTQSGSGSDPESAALNRRNAIPVNGNPKPKPKPTKRKSRASKRTTTTFITADPTNFRQMVQQVTGARFGSNAQLPVAPVLKPEPHRPVNQMQGFLPTLDTSAFLLDHQSEQEQQQQQQQVVGPTTAEMVAGVQPCLAIPTPADDGGAGSDFESFSSFPTLDSWKAM